MVHETQDTGRLRYAHQLPDADETCGVDNNQLVESGVDHDCGSAFMEMQLRGSERPCVCKCDVHTEGSRARTGD
eukprot:1729664-Rhodomonas_salina.1